MGKILKALLISTGLTENIPNCKLYLRTGVCLPGLSSHGAPAGSFISPWGRLALPPPADPAAERPETPPSRSGHPGPGPQPTPQQLQVKPTAPSHSHK